MSPVKAPRNSKLKVFRTAIGFHDAYVAAPSQKAAIEAWGAGKDVFARGEAEQVTDPKLTSEPLASPGVVIKRLRGTLEENIAALPEEEHRPARSTGRRRIAEPARKAAPKPSRAELERAEQELAAAAERHKRELDALAERQARLEQERRALILSHSEELAMLELTRNSAAASYNEALEDWRLS